MSLNSVLDPAVIPPATIVRRIKLEERTLTFQIKTSLLPKGVNYVYSVFLRGSDENSNDEPLLQWISMPGTDDLIEAYRKWRKK